MADALQDVIGLLQVKLNKLAEKCGELQRLVQLLEGENEQLNAELQQQQRELQSLRADNEYLKMSHKLASDPDELVVTRRRIGQMIRDIDKCISQLKE